MKWQTQEFDYLKQTAQAIYNSVAVLSSEEQNNFIRNIKYANETLFRSAADHRKFEVKTVNTTIGIFQSQGKSNYCGLCCINNAICGNGEAPLISIDEMDEIADRLWIDMVNNPCYGLITTVLEVLRDREGYYSCEVLKAACENVGFNMVYLDSRPILGMSDYEAGVSVIQQLHESYGIATLIIRLATSQHWITIKLIHTELILLDSKMNAPYTVTSNDVGQFIKQNVQHPGAVFILVPVDGEKMLLKKDGEDQTDNDSRMQAKVVDTNIDSTDVTKNINENQEDSSIDRKTYELRQNPKQKRRSSYEYDIPSKYKRIYLKKRVNLNHDTNKDSEETVCTSDMTGNISDELPDLGNEPETTEWKPPKTKAEKEKAKLQYIQDRNREIRERLEDHRLELNPHQEHRRHVLACDIYQFFNNILTGNRLKPAAEGLFWSNRLSIDGKRRKIGMTIGNSCLGIVDSIILGDDFHLDPKELYGTLFHEFVHAFVYINQIRDYSAHGSVWQSKVKQLIKKVKQNRDLMPASIKNLPLEIKDIR